MRWSALLLALPAVACLAQTETFQLGGQLGSRPTLLVLHGNKAADGALQLTGEYIVLTTLQRRFLDGEASPEIGVTSLREGTGPILFGRAPTGELRGSLRGGTFKGVRYAPGGQERERFEFSADFPSLEKYSASIRCDAADARYASTLHLAVDAGRLQSLDWRSTVAGQSCAVAGAEQQAWKGGLRFAAGRCNITLREIGEFVWVTADGCAEHCGSQAYLEPMVIDRRGYCRLLRPEPGK